MGDTISMRVWNQDSISAKTKVRPDGKVSIPFVNDVDAAGATPTELAARVQVRLKDFIVNPVVTVTLDELRPLLVAVMGEVTRPGNYQLEAGAGVLQALAIAGGPTAFADRDRIMVLRQKPDGSGVDADPLQVLVAHAARRARVHVPPPGRRRGRGRVAVFLPIAAGVLALAVGQTDATWNRGGNPQREPDPAAATATPVPPGPPPQSSNDIAGPAGVPYMPLVGVPPADTQGVFLDLALLSQLRARSLVGTSGGSTWGTDFEVTPGIALRVITPLLTLSVGYAPRLTVPFAVGGFELAVLNRATLRAEWRFASLWTATAQGVFVVGDYSQLIPASTPAGPGPTPPVYRPRSLLPDLPVRRHRHHRAHRRHSLAPDPAHARRAATSTSGGTGPEGEANQPRAWGPQGEVGFAWDPSPTSTLTTSAVGQNWIMSGTENFFITTLTENWRQAWTSEIETTFGLGGGFANREVESRTAAGKVVPVARASLVYQSASLQPLRLTLDLALAPFFDTYARMPYQRVTLSASFDWRPSEAWRLGASFAGALAPYTVRAPESYGTTGLSGELLARSHPGLEPGWVRPVPVPGRDRRRRHVPAVDRLLLARVARPALALSAPPWGEKTWSPGALFASPMGRIRVTERPGSRMFAGVYQYKPSHCGAFSSTSPTLTPFVPTSAYMRHGTSHIRRIGLPSACLVQHGRGAGSS